VDMLMRCLANQSRMSLVLWLKALSMTMWTSRPAGAFLSVASRNLRKSTARWRGMHLPITVPGLTSVLAVTAAITPAKSVVVPYRSQSWVRRST
jgi:hypothetical protein